MKKIYCSKCKKTIETDSNICPQCNSEIKEKKNNLFLNFLNGVVIVLIIGFVASFFSNDDTSYEEIDTIKEQETTSNCKAYNVKVEYYSKSKYNLSVELKNKNDCTWKIKSYSKVRVFFTDSSYEDVYLSTNINLKPGEKYGFDDCYLGSNNEDKTISSVRFID